MSLGPDMTGHWANPAPRLWRSGAYTIKEGNGKRPRFNVHRDRLLLATFPTLEQAKDGAAKLSALDRRMKP